MSYALNIMSAEHTPIPEDVDALKALVLAQQSLLSERAVEIEHLKLVIAKLQRLQFGRRSEKLDREIEQLELRLEELQVSAVPVTHTRSRSLPRKHRCAGRCQNICRAPALNTRPPAPALTVGQRCARSART